MQQIQNLIRIYELKKVEKDRQQNQTDSLQMGRIVAGFMIPIRQQDRFPGNRRTTHHLTQGLTFALFLPFPPGQIGADPLFQVLKHIYLNLLKPILFLFYHYFSNP